LLSISIDQILVCFLILKFLFHNNKGFHSDNQNVFNFLFCLINIFSIIFKISHPLLSFLIKIVDKTKTAPNYIGFPTAKDIPQVFNTTIRLTVLVFIKFLDNFLYLLSWIIKMSNGFIDFSNLKIVNSSINDGFWLSKFSFRLIKLLTFKKLKLVLVLYFCSYKIGVFPIELYDFHLHVKILLIVRVVNIL